jgi:hypothetical protein
MDSSLRAHIRVDGQTAFAVAFVCAVMLNLGQSPLGTKFHGNKVPWGQSSVGTKLRGDEVSWEQSSAGTKSLGRKFLSVPAVCRSTRSVIRVS